MAYYTVSQKSSHLLTVCTLSNQPISNIFALLESVWNLR